MTNRGISASQRWLPNDPAALQRGFAVIQDEIEARGAGRIHPVIQRFQRLIDDDPVVRMYVTQCSRRSWRSGPGSWTARTPATS
ncbi:MAG: hypothetical protein ACYTG6_17865 [Planctomycetota bacterium]